MGDDGHSIDWQIIEVPMYERKMGALVAVIEILCLSAGFICIHWFIDYGCDRTSSSNAKYFPWVIFRFIGWGRYYSSSNTDLKVVKYMFIWQCPGETEKYALWYDDICWSQYGHINAMRIYLLVLKFKMATLVKWKLNNEHFTNLPHI